MPSLNTNVASLYASRNLMTAQSKMADSVERLSSGMRINRAKDDAAGLGISNALSSQINGANQGIRNLNDGISLVQTAEGAINEASEMAQRILTLATQARNGSASSNDRKSIVNEMKALLSSINGMTSRTKFGDKELLMVSTGATATDTKFQIAASASSTDTVNLANDAFRNIGSGTTATTEANTFTITSGLIQGQAITIGGLTITAGSSGATAAQVAEAFVTGATAGGANAAVKSNAIAAVGGVATPWVFAQVGGTYANGQFTVTATDATRLNTNVADVIVSNVGNPGYMLSTVQGGAASAGQAGDLNTAINALSTSLDAGTDSEATTQTLMTTVVTRTNEYITSLNTQRGKLGAYQNQLESSVNNVSDLSVNLSAARSRVQDTDYAQETASLTKGQILQQAATAMLAQANQMPNVILSLLK
jgi:flagellin